MYSTFDTYNPTKEDLIANAPEGATHYSPETDTNYLMFWKYKDGRWLCRELHSTTWSEEYSEYAKGDIDAGIIKAIESPTTSESVNLTAMRERILEIRKEREAGIDEEQDLINKLASMGFKLIEDINEKLEEAKEQHELQDWRNWKAGDILILVGSKDVVTDPSFTVGKSYQIHHFEEHGPDHTYLVVIDDSDEQNGYLADSGVFKFHSRPTK